MKFKSAPPKSYERQADAVLDQANPVAGYQYEVLATTRNVRIYSITIQVTWTVQPSPLQVWITIDGQTYECFRIDPVTATPYQLHTFRIDLNRNMIDVASGVTPSGFVLEGKSVRVQAETVAGTSSNMTCRVKYGVLKP